MSETTGAFTRIITALQDLVRASYLTQQTMAAGLTTNTNLTTYTVAGLPATAPLGRMVFASNGRNTGQGAGAGTGCIVVGSGAVWNAVWSGVAVTA